MASWIGNEITITHSPLVAYLRGATIKWENYFDDDISSCLQQSPVTIDASKSFDPDIQGNLISIGPDSQKIGSGTILLFMLCFRRSRMTKG